MVVNPTFDATYGNPILIPFDTNNTPYDIIGTYEDVFIHTE